MNLFETRYDVEPKDYTYHNWPAAEYSKPDFTQLCELSETEHMNKLTPEDIQNHAYGMAMVRFFLSGHNIPHVDAVSYAGITGFEEHDGGLLAVVGGILTLPNERNKGHGLATTSALCEVASSAEAISQYGHVGLLARCNEHSHSLTDKLGFAEKGMELGKMVMVKMF